MSEGTNTIRVPPIFCPHGNVNRILSMYAHEYMSIFGPSFFASLKPSLIVKHGIGDGMLSIAFRNPFSVKEFGGARAARMYEKYVLENPRIMLDIAAACDEGLVLNCSCRHQECHGRVVVALAVRMTEERTWSDEPHVKVMDVGSKRVYRLFGEKGAVDEWVSERVTHRAMQMVEDEEAGRWKYAVVEELFPFTHIFDSGVRKAMHY